LLVKYAAKKTWPEKSPSWEHQGDADNVDAFAKEFATIEQLGLDAEFVVMTKDGGDQGIRFFRVASVSPYQFAPAGPHSGSDSTSGAAAPADADGEEAPSEPEGLPSLSPVISMIFYMGKVGLIAALAIAAMAGVMSYVRSWLGG
jgi:hypothetical protein